MAEYNKKIIKMVDYEAMRAAFDEKFKETMQLVENGEDHLDNLAEGFHEADGVIFQMPAADVVPKVNDAEGGREGGLGHVVRCRYCSPENGSAFQWVFEDIGVTVTLEGGVLTICNCYGDEAEMPIDYCPNCGAKMDAKA